MNYSTVLGTIKNHELQTLFGFTEDQSVTIRKYVIEMDTGNPQPINTFLKNHEWKKIEETPGEIIACGSYGCIYIEDDKHVIKINKRPGQLAIFLEVLISEILFQANIQELKVPRVDTMGMVAYQGNFYPGYVMDRVDGKVLHEVNDKNRLIAMNGLFKGLTKYQRLFTFSHRDLHSGNVMVDKNNVPYMIDFGAACVSIKQTNGFVGLRKPFGRTNGCLNRSHDVCMLIISLYNITEMKQIEQLALDICRAYGENNIFHWHKIYSMYDKQLIYTPEYLSSTLTRFCVYTLKL